MPLFRLGNNEITGLDPALMHQDCGRAIVARTSGTCAYPLKIPKSDRGPWHISFEFLADIGGHCFFLSEFPCSQGVGIVLRVPEAQSLLWKFSTTRADVVQSRKRDMLQSRSDIHSHCLHWKLGVGGSQLKTCVVLSSSLHVLRSSF